MAWFSGIVLLGAASFGGKPQPPFVTDLVMLGRSPAIHAKINGHDAILEIDTGSFELRLSPAFVTENKLDQGTVRVGLPGAAEVVVKPVVEEIAEPSTPTLADSFEIKSNGILGLDLLRKYAIGIDEVDQKVAFWPGGNVSPEAASSWTLIGGQKKAPMESLPLTTKGPEDWYRIGSKLNDQGLDFIFDTGTALSSVNPSIARKLNLKTIAETEVEEIGHSERLSVVAADSLTFGTLKAAFPILNVEAQDDADSDGILGTEAVGQCKMLIDMPGSHLYLRRPELIRTKNPLERRLRAAGLDIFPDTAHHLVVAVEPGSSADKAGVSSGDTIVAFGNVPVSDLLAAFGLPSEQASTRSFLSMGMELLKKDLTVTIATAAGKKVGLSLPFRAG